MLFNNQFTTRLRRVPGGESSFALFANRHGCVDFGNGRTSTFRPEHQVDGRVARSEASMRFHFLRRFNVQNNYTFTPSEQQSGSRPARRW